MNWISQKVSKYYNSEERVSGKLKLTWLKTDKWIT
jgi:hypothetical protein